MWFISRIQYGIQDGNNIFKFACYLKFAVLIPIYAIIIDKEGVDQ